MPDRRLALVAALLAWPAAAPAQEVGLGFGRYFPQEDMNVFRADVLFPRREVLDPALVAEYRTADDGEKSRWYGLGVDVSLFRGAGPGPYAVIGGMAGFGDGPADTFWASWSAGLGYTLLANSGVSFAGEVRWRGMTDRDVPGIEVLGRLGIRLSPIPQGPPADSLPPIKPSVDPGRVPPPDLNTTAPVPPAAAAVPEGGVDLRVTGVIATAREAMGAPYRWGGTGEGGFDCSGLIQYAYGEHGVPLPRRSADQAREGRAVERSVDALRPGDILTFAERGNGISHVGLYLGNGEFIHSASQGVQVSQLSEDDPYGRWWYQRWRGARRILE